jgi:hypothetical protein
MDARDREAGRPPRVNLVLEPWVLIQCRLDKKFLKVSNNLRVEAPPRRLIPKEKENQCPALPVHRLVEDAIVSIPEALDIE